MSSFFTIPSLQKKRKRIEGSEAPKKRFATPKSKGAPRDSRPPHAPPRPRRDESISGSDDDDDNNRGLEEEFEGLSDQGSSSGSEDGEETAAERRLRLAERYLDNIREEVDEVGFDAEEIDRDLIAERLQEDAAESKGRMYRKLAAELSFGNASHSVFRNNSEAVTSIATCPPYAYTVSKDLYLTKWRIQELPANQFPQKKKSKKPPPPPRRKPTQLAMIRGDKTKSKDSSYQGHIDSILTVAASQDGKFVVTGGKDRRIIVWDASTLTPLRIFSQHRDAVTGLAFRRGTNQLYSSSKDRTIKVWSLDELAYIETLFGHQDEVVDIAALAQERCISVGARDRTARLWKVVEETQLVFRGGGGAEKKSKSKSPKVLEGSMDRVAMIDEETFVTGGDNGCISLWVVHKKKPIFTIPQAHGMEPALSPDEASAEVHPTEDIIPAPQPRWITALTSIPYSDVIISGSWDGQVRVWKLSNDKKKLEALPSLSSSDDEEDQGIVRGVVNDISVFERGDRGKEGACVVVAVGKEHRMGRWKTVQGARNGGVVFEIPRVEQRKSNGVEKDVENGVHVDGVDT
ncbi:WD40-repeat-containing domain protein [Amylocarpus encephaloides]|uniref:WD40-repeat-containing domain protein n=1 Tax=Amylocarpus encephaloides TaxID=45428 RepID=A0A9P7YFM6_9HELO|nr:WD40-repeat-containing domain protein [Amylocarpus encephaloides]